MSNKDVLCLTAASSDGVLSSFGLSRLLTRPN